jgi:hypothetical protein
MKLYHFTSMEHWKSIQESGRLLPTESNVGSPLYHWPPTGAHRGPDVVWLLSTPKLNGFPHGLLGSSQDKLAVRITVDLPNPIRWLDWEWTAMMHPRWHEAIVETGGGPDAVKDWYIWPVPIRQRHWGQVVHTRSGREMWRQDG